MNKLVYSFRESNSRETTNFKEVEAVAAIFEIMVNFQILEAEAEVEMVHLLKLEAEGVKSSLLPDTAIGDTDLPLTQVICLKNLPDLKT